MDEPRRLLRSKTNRVIAGVCGGLGEYLNIDPTLLRIGLALLVFAGGFGAAAYLVLWLIMPDADQANQTVEQRTAQAAQEMKTAAEKAGQALRSDERNNGKIIVGIILVAVGILAFGHTLWPWSFFRWDYFWPILIIIFGASIIFKRK